MNKLVILMVIINVIMIANILIDKKKQEEARFNQEVCIQELIPIDDWELLED